MRYNILIEVSIWALQMETNRLEIHVMNIILLNTILILGAKSLVSTSEIVQCSAQASGDQILTGI